MVSHNIAIEHVNQGPTRTWHVLEIYMNGISACDFIIKKPNTIIHRNKKTVLTLVWEQFTLKCLTWMKYFIIWQRKIQKKILSLSNTWLSQKMSKDRLHTRWMKLDEWTTQKNQIHFDLRASLVKESNIYEVQWWGIIDMTTVI